MYISMMITVMSSCHFAQIPNSDLLCTRQCAKWSVFIALYEHCVMPFGIWNIL